jgi:hypothetical protein
MRLSADERERQVLDAWRAERLIGLGVEPPLAVELAATVDWHELADLLARGCPPHLALEILR